MWKHIREDYTPSNHPSHIACALPEGNLPPPAIRAAVKHGSRRITSTIFQLATTHCFDASYSEKFRPNAEDYTTCPCELIPRPNQRRPPRCPPRRHTHTKEHVIFHCHATLASRLTHLRGLSSLREILISENHTQRLCRFLRETRSSLFRPLVNPHTPRPPPWPDPPY